MTEINQNEEKIINYLLNSASDEDAVEIESRLSSDEEYRKEVETVEMVLIDRFVQGEMSSDESAAFESMYLNFPELREKVEKSRQFHQQFEIWRAEESTEAVPQRRFGWFDFRLPAFAYAAALFLFLIVGGTLLYFTKPGENIAEVNDNQNSNTFIATAENKSKEILPLAVDNVNSSNLNSESNQQSPRSEDYASANKPTPKNKPTENSNAKSPAESPPQLAYNKKKRFPPVNDDITDEMNIEISPEDRVMGAEDEPQAVFVTKPNLSNTIKLTFPAKMEKYFKIAVIKSKGGRNVVVCGEKASAGKCAVTRIENDQLIIEIPSRRMPVGEYVVKIEKTGKQTYSFPFSRTKKKKHGTK